MDVACAVAFLLVLVLGGGAYGVRYLTSGRARHARVDKEGKSALVATSAMEGFYWFIEPIAAACQRLGCSADVVSWLSLVLGLGAAVAFAFGHFGLGALVAAISAGFDAVDGLVARRMGTASDAGEVLDAVVDRYVDFALLAGLAVFFSDRRWLLVIALAAIQASFMVSYSTAKAEALRITPPRGSMKRTERAVLVILGAVASALSKSELPILFGMLLIAVFGNVSAIGRFAAIRAALTATATNPPTDAPSKDDAASAVLK